ncbi:MAG TPA: N-acetyl-D-Glu racemase DgcA [Pseudolabrys sp.]|nr:N-acetyl-D-Glu racemase DgcA [Pseudolabrys sp.]
MDVPLTLVLATERWPIRGSFAISRGAKTEAVVVVAEVSDGNARGRGECVPYARYGESIETVTTAIEKMRPELERGIDRESLQKTMPAGAARNALDCALWDFEAKRSGRPAHELAGLPPLRPLTTAFTISLAAPAEMARAAGWAADRTLLKIKLGADGDPDRIRAVRDAVPHVTLIADANEGWTDSNIAANLEACARADFALVEQPLPQGRDAALGRMNRPLPVCADESVHDRASLSALAGKYDAVNVKLDKAGGLTEALAMIAEAERMKFTVMVGCMVATSLAMAPAMLPAQKARFVDLDGPLLLSRDRAEGLRYADSLVYPPSSSLWG